MSAYDYRAARDRIFGIVRDSEGKVKQYIPSPATMSERVLLLALVEFAPNIEPSTESVALMIGTDERSVRRLLRNCEAKGLLLVEHRTGRRSRYTITCDPGFKAPPDSAPPLASGPPTPDSEPSPPLTLSPPKQTTEAVKEADKSTRRMRRTSSKPLPEEWQPTAKHEAFAKEHRLNLSLEVASFRGHAESHDRRAVVWNGAFSSWLARSVQFSRGSRGNAPIVQTGGTIRQGDTSWFEDGIGGAK